MISMRNNRLRSTFAFLMLSTAYMLLLCGQASASGVVNLSSDKTVVTYEGSANTQSLLKVSFNGLSYIFEETLAGATTTAGSGCTQVSTRKVSCPTIEVVSINLNMGENTVVSPVPPADTDSVMMGGASAIPAHVLTTIVDVGAVTAGDGPVDVYANDSGAINGGAGYDNIRTDGSINSIDGGAKDDHITIKNSVITPPGTEFSYGVGGGPGTDLIDASASTANLHYNASTGTDIAIGGSGSDEFTFGTDRDLVFGGPGNDRFYDTGAYNTPEADLSEVWGGEGNDVFIDMNPTRKDVTHFEGGPGMDTVTYSTSLNNPAWHPPIRISFDDPADDGVMSFQGVPEGDHFHVSVENIGGYVEIADDNEFAGNDEFVGSEQPNEIKAGLGDDLVYANGGNDKLVGYDGIDQMYGGAGNDVFDDMANHDYDDVYSGEAGNDLFLLENGADSVEGGAGIDTVSYEGYPGGVEFSLDNVDSLEYGIGSPHGDIIYGGLGPNKIDGGDGDDTFNFVEGGIDEITCGDGNDIVDADTSDVLVDEEFCESVTRH